MRLTSIGLALALSLTWLGCKQGSSSPLSTLLLAGAAAGGPGTSDQSLTGDIPAGPSASDATLSIPEVVDPNSTVSDFDPNHPLHILPSAAGTGFAGGLTVVFSKQIDCKSFGNLDSGGRWYTRMTAASASDFLVIKKINSDGTLKDVKTNGLLLCYTGWHVFDPGREYYGPQQLLIWHPGDPGEFRLDNPSGLEGDGQYLFLISHKIRGIRGDQFQQTDSRVTELPAGSPYYPIKVPIYSCVAATYAPRTMLRANLMKDSSGERYIHPTGPGFINSPLAFPWTEDTLYTPLKLLQRTYVPEWKNLHMFETQAPPSLSLPSCIKNPGKLDEFVISVASAADQAEWSTRCGAEGGMWIPSWQARTPAQLYASPSSCIVPETQSCNRTTSLVPVGRWFSPEGKPSQKYTYWDTEVMRIEVKDSCQAGWQKIKLTGMNIDGPLPAWYKYYALTLQNEQSNAVYGVTLAASDTKSSSATALVYIPKGNSSFQIRWHNDAARKGVYDANLLLKTVGIVPSDTPLPAPASPMKRTGRSYCDVAGRLYFSEKGAIWYAAHSTATYCFSNLQPGRYRIRLTGGGLGNLPTDYQAFALKVTGGRDVAVASLPANISQATADVFLNLDETAMLSVSLQNGFGSSNETTAGFELRAIELKRLGPAQ
ncbi:MAG: hypothetical protein JNM27_00180 [Leptospirales bacterium]|nr:hypothetical protein [Leptospirales bacterium]